MFETVVRVDKPRKNVIIPTLEEDLDGLKKTLTDLATSKEKTLISLTKKRLTVFFLPTLTVTYQTCT